MIEETLCGLPKEIENTDNEPMGICISYDPEEQEWGVSYADEGSVCAVYRKTLDEALKDIHAEYKKIYGVNLC